jgi:hypothetical protein
MRLLAYLIIMAGAWFLFAAAGLPQVAISAPDGAGAGAIAAQATAARPLPLPTIPPVMRATAVAQRPTASYQLPVANPLPHVAGLNRELFNGRLRYCYTSDGWGRAEKAAMGQAFQSWQGAGVAFNEVGDVGRCDLQLAIVYDPASPFAGWATLGPGFGPELPAKLFMNQVFGFDPLVAAHELGHVLGLDHAPSGVMASPAQAWPGAAEFAAVKSIWGLE